MNMQTMPGNFLRVLFLSLTSLSVFSCSGSDTLQQRVEFPEVTANSLSGMTQLAFVKLIDREMAVLSPHLRAHQGQIVLGQNQLQLIMSSIPPLGDGSDFHPLFARIYKSTGKTWQAQSWQPPVEISISNKSGDPLQLIGQDIEHQNEQTKFITLFRSRSPGGGQARLELEFSGESPLVRATLINQGVPGPLRWQLRLASGSGEEHPIPLNQDQFAGITLNLLPDVFTILAGSPLNIKSDHRNILLTANAMEAAGKSSFLLLFGRTTALLQPALVTQLKQCLIDVKKRSKNDVDCLRLSVQNTETWQIQLPLRNPPVRSDKRLFQALYVHDAQGAFVGTLPIFEGEQLKLNLQPGHNLEMLYPDNQGVLKKLSFDEDTRSAQLPAPAFGSILVELNPGRPGFVEIHDAIRQESISFASILAHRPSDILSAHSFLQKTWPFQANLPAGDYHMQIMDGMERLCLQNFTILPGRRQIISCQNDDPQPELSLRANLSMDASHSSEELLQASRFQAVGRTLRNARDENDALTEIPMMIVEDLNLGLSLRAFPADDNTRKAWQLVKPKDNEALLPAFAKFVRDQKPPLQLVFECPSINFPIEEYRWLALTIQPDILEVFGCKTDFIDELLQIAHKLQQKSDKAIKLAAASPFPTRLDSAGFIPAIYVPNPISNPTQSKAENLVAALRDGQYSLGLRSEIAVPGPLPVPHQTGMQSVTVKIRSYDLKDQGALIRVYDQKDQLTEQAIAPSRDHDQTLRINLRLRPESRFLRFELLSQGLSADSKQDGLTQPFLLATSNFLSLNGQP